MRREGDCPPHYVTLASSPYAEPSFQAANVNGALWGHEVDWSPQLRQTTRQCGCRAKMQPARSCCAKNATGSGRCKVGLELATDGAQPSVFGNDCPRFCKNSETALLDSSLPEFRTRVPAKPVSLSPSLSHIVCHCLSVCHEQLVLQEYDVLSTQILVESKK